MTDPSSRHRTRNHAAAGAALLLLVAVGYAYVETRSPPMGGDTAARIAAETARGEGTIIRVAALTPFSWTELYVFGPYTSEGTAEQLMGIPYRYGWSAVQSREDRHFLVFVDSSRIVAAFDHPYRAGIFNMGQKLTDVRVTAQEASFRVRRDGSFTNGAPVFRLDPLRR